MAFIENIHSQHFILIGKDLYFPSSITEKTIESIFPKKNITVNYSTSAKGKSIDFLMKHQPRDDLQKQAMQFYM